MPVAQCRLRGYRRSPFHHRSRRRLKPASRRARSASSRCISYGHPVGHMDPIMALRAPAGRWVNRDCVRPPSGALQGPACSAPSGRRHYSFDPGRPSARWGRRRGCQPTTADVPITHDHARAPRRACKLISLSRASQTARWHLQAAILSAKLAASAAMEHMRAPGCREGLRRRPQQNRGRRGAVGRRGSASMCKSHLYEIQHPRRDVAGCASERQGLQTGSLSYGAAGSGRVSTGSSIAPSSSRLASPSSFK